MREEIVLVAFVSNKKKSISDCIHEVSSLENHTISNTKINLQLLNGCTVNSGPQIDLCLGVTAVIKPVLQGQRVDLEYCAKCVFSINMSIFLVLLQNKGFREVLIKASNFICKVTIKKSLKKVVKLVKKSCDAQVQTKRLGREFLGVSHLNFRRSRENFLQTLEVCFFLI